MRDENNFLLLNLLASSCLFAMSHCHFGFFFLLVDGWVTSLTSTTNDNKKIWRDLFESRRRLRWMRVCHWVVKFQRIIRDDGAKKVQVVRGLMMSHSRHSVREWVREELVRLFNFNEIHHHLTSHHISKRLHCVLALWRACVVIFKIQRFQGHLFTSSPSFFIYFIWIATRSTNTFANPLGIPFACLCAVFMDCQRTAERKTTMLEMWDLWKLLDINRRVRVRTHWNLNWPSQSVVYATTRMF